MSSSEKRLKIGFIDRPLFKMLGIAVLVMAVSATGLYFIFSAYVLDQAEKSIQSLMFSHRGIHHYVQSIMLPALHEFKDEGRIPNEFYAPEILSSSYIVRNQHNFYNEALEESGRDKVYYKMAANNPRNPVNKADELEKDLIKMFNENPDSKIYREVVDIEGEPHLYVAMPFLKNGPNCMVCHGSRDTAPDQLQERYVGEGGFNEELGEIRAIESIRVPLHNEYFVVYVASGAVGSGALVIWMLFFINRRLSHKVSKRTKDLEFEIQERKTAEEEVKQLNLDLENRVFERTQQLEAANKELDSFAYSVSHDLRAPLRRIDGFSQALNEDYSDQLDETAERYLDRIRHGCNNMGDLIDDLLKMSRLVRGELNREEVNLSEVAQTLLLELQESDPERDIEVVIQEDLLVFVDRGLIKAVLENLIGNAWKFTGKTKHAKIEFGMFEKEGKKHFYVKDNGAGFNMEYVSKLFAPFQRFHSQDEFEGTGIGLATVQRIIHRHGGSVSAEAKEGQGATFYFSLPQY